MTIEDSTVDPSNERAGMQGHEFRVGVVCVEGVAGFEGLPCIGPLDGVKIDTSLSLRGEPVLFLTVTTASIVDEPPRQVYRCVIVSLPSAVRTTALT